METINKRHIWIFFSILIVIMVAAYVMNVFYNGIPPAKPIENQYENDHNSSQASYTTVRDSEGYIVFQTGLPVFVEDEYISENNQHYIITNVNGLEAIAQPKKGTDPDFADWEPEPALPINKAVPVQAVTRPTHIVIYHTHSDESYIPNSGTPSKPGAGDVYNVGESFKNALTNAGVSVTQSDNQHEPHDINAYHRSRKTAFQLLKEQPDAIFDIHRDAAPLQAYETSVNGQETSRVMIVIGRSNPHPASNKRFARQIKATCDELYPGLMRGIFIGRGDYNQDLYPTALLFEIGTDTASLETSMRASTCLADAIIATLEKYR